MTKPTKKTPRKICAGRDRRDPILQKRSLFVQEYLIDLDGTKAAIRAGYSATSARQIAAELLKVSDIAAQIKVAQEERAQRVGITADEVLQRMWAIATADSGEICELRRTCCRYCWGTNNKYQRTPREMREAVAAFNRDALRSQGDCESLSVEFDEEGGVGFDKLRDPNDNCLECFGEGTETPYFKDTRRLSKGAKLLYAGTS